MSASTGNSFLAPLPSFSPPRAGFGLAYLTEEQIRDDLKSGRRVRVLADWCPPSSGYHLYYPSRRQPTQAFALLVDACATTRRRSLHNNLEFRDTCFNHLGHVEANLDPVPFETRESAIFLGPYRIVHSLGLSNLRRSLKSP
jgi:hypothetical protein